MLEIFWFETPFALYGWIGMIGAVAMIFAIWAATCAYIFRVFDR